MSVHQTIENSIYPRETPWKIIIYNILRWCASTSVRVHQYNSFYSRERNPLKKLSTEIFHLIQKDTTNIIKRHPPAFKSWGRRKHFPLAGSEGQKGVRIRVVPIQSLLAQITAFSPLSCPNSRSPHAFGPEFLPFFCPILARVLNLWEESILFLNCLHFF